MRKTGQNINCKACGKEFYLRACYIKEGRRFCSSACYHKHQETLVGENGPNWKGDNLTHRNSGHTRARQMYETKECNRCQSTRFLVRHHIDRSTFNNDKSNIEILCKSCHTKEHWKERRKERIDDTDGRKDAGGVEAVSV